VSWNAKMVFTQAQGVEAKRNQHTNALTEVKRLSKESDVTVGILKGYVC